MYREPAIIQSRMEPDRKPLHFVGTSLRDLREMPENVQDVFGGALLDAQYGDTPAGARSFGEGLPGHVLKLAENHHGNTYRAAYTVAYPRAVYVLHALQKKSKSGIRTPALELNLIRLRLSAAAMHYRQHYPLEGDPR